MTKISFYPGILNVFRIICLLVLSFAFTGLSLNAQDLSQTEGDTIKKYTIKEVVITANRYENKILNTGASVEVLNKNEIRKYPVSDVSGLLQYLPGIYTSSTDGMGHNPMIVLRGFYGGGEAEYLSILIDGIPVNDLETGLVNWNFVPLEEVRKIEFIKGGSSPLYGDAAMGGVMNIITGKTDVPFTNASIGYGSFNSYILSLSHGGKVGKSRYELYVSDDHTDGFRKHSNWNSVNFGGKFKIPLKTKSTLTLSSFNQILRSDEPGPLSENLIKLDREQSLPYYRKDGKDQQRYVFRLDFNNKINKNSDLDASFSYQHKGAKDVRTYTNLPVILDPFTFVPIGVYDTTMYGDTKRRELNTNQFDLDIKLLNRNQELNSRITGGIEVNYGQYSNKFIDLYNGFEHDYRNNFLELDTTGTKGTGYRFKSAAFLSGEIHLFEPLKLIAGLRYDVIYDKFDSEIPDSSLNINNDAFSPKVGLNLNLGETDRYSGSIFVSFSQSFKAPTIDQLTDLKTLKSAIFFQAGPTYHMMIIETDPFSNSGLKPQKSTNYEIGTYQSYEFSENFAGELSLSAYQIKVKDEIDFDLETFSYQNISNSMHTGLEANIKLSYKSSWNGYLSIAYTEAKFASGDNDGNFLTGVPRTVFLAGLSYFPLNGFGGGIYFNSAQNIYLDDENTSKIDPYGIFNIRLNYKYNFLTVYVDVNNIFDKSYNTAGYMMMNEKFLYPAVGRFLKAGVSFRF